ncbi:MAG: ubiquitin-like small modifier protein 1 [Candidatus Bipolaricaulia bacterium]
MRIELEIAFSFKRDLDEGYRFIELRDGADVETALRDWVGRHSQAEARLFDGDGSIRRHINVLINGGNVKLREGFKTVLSDGDRLTILPPVGGG